MPTGRGFSLFGGAKLKSIQQGTTTLTNTSAVNITISSVDLTKAVSMCSTKGPTLKFNDGSGRIGVYAGMAPIAVTAKLTSPTNLQLQKALHYKDTVVNWIVIEFESGVSVQRGDITVNLNSGNTVTATISSVDTSKSIILGSERQTAALDPDFGGCPTRRGFNSPTQIYFDWYSDSVYFDPAVYKYIHWQVLTFVD